jgi:hypothetical protein
VGLDLRQCALCALFFPSSWFYVQVRRQEYGLTVHDTARLLSDKWGLVQTPDTTRSTSHNTNNTEHMVQLQSWNTHDSFVGDYTTCIYARTSFCA